MLQRFEEALGPDLRWITQRNVVVELMVDLEDSWYRGAKSLFWEGFRKADAELKRRPRG